MKISFLCVISVSLLCCSSLAQPISPYKPTTSESELEIEQSCLQNLPPRDKFEQSLIRYSSALFTPRETDAPNDDPFIEDCSTVGVGNTSENDSVREILEIPAQTPECHDVLFYTAELDPVVCGYNALFAGANIDYEPTTLEERAAKLACQLDLPHPEGNRATLVRYEAEPVGAFPGYFQINTQAPYDGDPYVEDCALARNPGAAETRAIINIYQIESCHDVLFFAGGTDPVVCLYVQLNLNMTPYVPMTPSESTMKTQCKESLPELEKYEVTLIEYSGQEVFETNTANTDRFTEDCSTISISTSSSVEPRSIVFVRGTQDVCRDVVFFNGEGNPVVCDYNALFAGANIDYEPKTLEERAAKLACQLNLPHPERSRATLVRYEAEPVGAFPGYFQINTQAPYDDDPYVEDCALARNPGAAETRAIINIYQIESCHDVLFFAGGTDPVVCLYVGLNLIMTPYVPMTPSESTMKTQCKESMPELEKYEVTLIEYSGQEVFETNTANTDRFTEDCSTISISTSSSVEPRSIVFVRGTQDVCRDVVFFNGEGNPVVCDYNALFAGANIDYEPKTLEERAAKLACQLDLPHPEGNRATLVRYEAEPVGAFPGYFQINTQAPYDGDPYVEDCALARNPGAAETRAIINIYQIESCHDVLFFAGGTDPVVCLYVQLNLNMTPYVPMTPSESTMKTQCKESLPELEKYEVTLIEYSGQEVFETNTANTDRFTEDCLTISISTSSSVEPRSIVFVRGTQDVCRDVVFFNGEGNPVVCDYNALFAGGNTDYRPSNSVERAIQQRCQDNLPHPNNTDVALVEYIAEPKTRFPGFTLRYVSNNVTDNESPYMEECGNFFEGSMSAMPTATREVIRIEESGTCHDVLYFEGDNPIVCLYIHPSNTTVHIGAPLAPGITVLVLASLSVIASAVLLITYLIFPTLQTLPSKVVMNLAVAFLLGDIFLIIQTSLILHDANENQEHINAVAVVTFYFFFARFLWMALSGFEMCRTIHVGTQLRFNSVKKRLRIFLIYLLTGWSLPVIPTSIMAIVHYEGLEGEEKGTPRLFTIGGFVVTLVPVGIVVIFNIGIIAYLTYVLYMAHKWQIKVSDAIASNRRKTNFSRIFIIILSLLGVTWITLFLVYVDDIAHTDAVQIITAFFNTIQPIFVCVSFVCTKKILRKYTDLFKGKSDVDPTEISNVQNRFRNRRLLSFLFTDKELADSVPKYRFGRQRRTDSKISNTSMSILMRDSTSNFLVSGHAPSPSNGTCTPPKEPPSLAPITEELETEDVADELPSHATVNLKDSVL